jgi:serine/threonine-protein kinase
MSPEQCSQASELDARSDIYSLGVILYELLVGHVPFMGASPTAIMMKHLQEAAPSVLDERKDVPAAVGRVVARAMAKRPEDRYQSAGELSEALRLASEEPAPIVAAVTGAAAEDRATNRIVVPTDSNEVVRTTASEDQDEVTVVRQREREEVIDNSAVVYRDGPPPPETFNPWRILVPAAVGLLVIFGIIWALTRNSNQPTTNQQTAPLVVDPNGQPVQPMQSPTGQGERGIAGSPNTNANANSTASTGQNQNSAPPPSAENANARRNEGAPKNGNAKTPPEQQPEETPANANTGEGRTSPTPQPSEEPAASDEPPPAPSPKNPKRRQRELPKPELPTDTPAQPPAGDAQPIP